MFEFDDGTVIQGIASDKSADLNPFLVAAGATWTLSTTVHLSCSDDFGFEDPNDAAQPGTRPLVRARLRGLRQSQLSQAVFAAAGQGLVTRVLATRPEVSRVSSNAIKE